MDVALRSGLTELVDGKVVRLPCGIQSDKWRWKRSAFFPPDSRQSPQTLWKSKTQQHDEGQAQGEEREQ